MTRGGFGLGSQPNCAGLNSLWDFTTEHEISLTKKSFFFSKLSRYVYVNAQILSQNVGNVVYEKYILYQRIEQDFFDHDWSIGANLH